MIELHRSPLTSQNLFKDNFVSENNENVLNRKTCKSIMDSVPKKRWLREAVMEQQRWDSNQDLAQPINWGEENNLIAFENQKRPTVLVRVEQNEIKKISKSDIQIAMALVELRNANGLSKRSLCQF